MPMRAGDLDREVTIERYTFSRGPNNEPLETWTPDAEPLAASWRRATANERLAAAQVSASVTDIFEVRWTEDLEDLNPKDRLRYEGRIYDIGEVTEIGRREGQLIRATAVVDRE